MAASISRMDQSPLPFIHLMVVLKHLPRIENISTGKHYEIGLGLYYVHIGNVWGSPAPRRFLNYAKKKFKGFTQRPQQASSEFPWKHKIEDSQQTASKRRNGDDNILEAIVAPATKPSKRSRFQP